MSLWFSSLVPNDSSSRSALFLTRLEEMEQSIVKLKTEIRFYTPSAPIIGLSTSGNIPDPGVNAKFSINNPNTADEGGDHEEFADASESEETVSADAGELDDSMEQSN